MTLSRSLDATLEGLLAGDARLVTVHGLGGSGASRAARRALDGRPHLVVDLQGCARVAEVRARVPAVRRGVLLIDEVHHPRPVRAVVAELLRAPGARVVVAGRAPLGLEGEARVVVPPLDVEEGVALLVAELRRLGAPTAGVAPLVETLDGWPLALRALAAAVRVLGVEAVVRRGVLESALDDRCRGVLGSLLSSMTEAERHCARILSRATVGLSVDELLAGGVTTTPVVEGLLDRGALVREGDVVRLRRPVGGFVRSMTPAAEQRRADRRCAELFLREGERARDKVRNDPASATRALDRIATDLLPLVSGDDPRIAVRAALALEPLLTGRLDRELVFGVWRRALAAGAAASRATRAKLVLAWVRTLIARGDHEAAEEVLRTADELDEGPLSIAYRAIYLAHVEAWRGVLTEARTWLDEAERALEGAPEPARTHAREDAMLQRIFVAFEAQALDETERLCRRLAADAARTPSPRLVSLARRFSAEVLLRRERALEAAQLLERTRDELFSHGDAAGALFLWSRRIAALETAGEAARAREEARAAHTMAARAGEGAFEIAVLRALDERDVHTARVAELAWRSQIGALRREAEQWLAGQAGRVPGRILQLDATTGIATVAERRATFGRRRTLFAILEGLAAAHARGRALSSDELFEIGWPGEHAERASKRQRVQTAVWTLRKALLGDGLVTEPHGYALVPSLRVVRMG